MVEINNQRKAFLDMLLMEGTDNGRRENQEIMVMTSFWASCYWLLRSPSLTSLNPKLKSTGAGRFSFFPLVDALPQAAWPERLLSEKSGRSWHCSRLRSVALYYDWSWWYPSAIDRCSNIWASLPGAGYGQFESAGGSLIAKFKSGRNGQRDWCTEQSHRDYLRSGYLHHRLPVMGC